MESNEIGEVERTATALLHQPPGDRVDDVVGNVRRESVLRFIFALGH